MAKYKGQNRFDEADEKSYSEAIAEQQAMAVEEKSVEGDETSFKKRYGDLRRHMQQSLQQKDQELAEAKQQLEQATKQQIRFPKNDDEIEAWSKKYPDVSAIVDTIARKRANEALEEGEKRMQGLRDLETKIGRKEAEQQLLSLHPDFPKIRQDPEFHDWVSDQPTYIRDALYKNSTDAKSASRAIDLYKSDKGIRKKSTSPKSAAEAVGKTSRTAPSTQSRAAFSESQVSKMSNRDYDKNEDAILEAMRTGNFEYDMTGASR